MRSTSIFDALAEELEDTWQRSGEIREPADQLADDQHVPLSGRLE